ncbi:hypothetical protein MLD38_028570 [Melastoma candidum]|uniref:Uncharacterized protein n=1 Tax=Melastoma candidum TaxID=119954 RepID=A0ACB9N295_9MYRT|nr:hypothetical protein MLD38_028570 [Melastoma candidum]
MHKYPFPFLFLLLLHLPPTTHQTPALPSDAVSLLSFKSSADLDHRLPFTPLLSPFDFCRWPGVSCSPSNRVLRLSLPSFSLRGTFPPSTLSRLSFLRSLDLRNNSLSGPLPDLSSLPLLTTLILSRNSFLGSFPPSLPSLLRLRVLDLSHNNFSGPVPLDVLLLSRLHILLLGSNLFDGPLPPFNQTSLTVLNVSFNNFTGPIPSTPVLSQFRPAAFEGNAGLCGEIIGQPCKNHTPFFGSSPGNDTLEGSNSSVPLVQSHSSPPQNTVALSPTVAEGKKMARRTGVVVLGILIGVLCVVLVGSVWFMVIRGRDLRMSEDMATAEQPHLGTADGQRGEVNPELNPKVKSSKAEEGRIERASKSGYLIFSPGESELYTLEQLMRASAELLGRGTIGTTYKAVLDNRLVVTVKRLDSSKTSCTSEEAFEKHLGIVGGLRHPNLVPVRAYFQAKGERLVIFDYQPNGSLHNLIHGSRSARAKPLHWTSILKIAEDVTLGLVYLHQASRMIHGNLKSSNVLLGSDFEACLTDYCLSVIAEDNSSNSSEDPDFASYKAPETRKSIRQATFKSDVYAFGVLLLELLTGKHPSQHPSLAPSEMPDWVAAMREEDDGMGDERLAMLVEVATFCRTMSPEQRPSIGHVLKIIEGIKDSAVADDNQSTR